jgi:hypothetical protein
MYINWLKNKQMIKALKIVSLFLMISIFSACSIFKKGCHCPKFNQQKAPSKTIYNQMPNP